MLLLSLFFLGNALIPINAEKNSLQIPMKKEISCHMGSYFFGIWYQLVLKFLGIFDISSYRAVLIKQTECIWPKYAWCCRSMREFPLLFDTTMTKSVWKCHARSLKPSDFWVVVVILLVNVNGNWYWMVRKFLHGNLPINGLLTKLSQFPPPSEIRDPKNILKEYNVYSVGCWGFQQMNL